MDNWNLQQYYERKEWQRQHQAAKEAWLVQAYREKVEKEQAEALRLRTQAVQREADDQLPKPIVASSFRVRRK